MAAIEIYFISRMSQEKKSDTGKNPDRAENIVVSPEKNTIRHPLRPLCRSKNGVSISLSQFQKILKVFEVYLLDNMSFELITSGKSFVTLVTCKSFCRVKGTDVLTYQGILGKFLKKNREKI